ncbi:hypothetical protein [Parvicella tangerina]|uniref:Uncharacterized protein n=1 Tax=Parvicella tangerina TaxID=2829795 RepID=A0A916NQF2_9FLAO|nr:hypothetical protein [Parvicella tangerina]CAG5078934.1 hypothetical protein CRYO30217_00810 [Parvicella tangerina]
MKTTLKSLLLIALLAITLSGCQNYGTEKEFNGVQLFYTENVTEDEADKLGEFMIEAGFADGGEKSVQLEKKGDTYQFRMVVKEGFEEKEEFILLAKQFAQELSVNVFENAPVEVHLCSDRLETLKVVEM